ncbi:hypothetical protein DZS_13870 [Dickeya ananatis]
MANLRRPNPPASVSPKGNRAGRGEPNKFCRPSEQKDAPTRRFIWGATAPHTVAAKSPATSR